MTVNKTNISMTNAKDNIIIFKVILNGFIIGNLNLAKEKTDIDIIKIADILIIEKYRNLGIGKKLLENATNYLPSIGINKIYGIMVGDTEKLEHKHAYGVSIAAEPLYF